MNLADTSRRCPIFESNANIKLFDALMALILEVIPSDPNRDGYRQGTPKRPAFRHWRRAKIGRRFRLFFRFDSKARIVIFAWVNDEHTWRSPGAKTDPYFVFQKCPSLAIRPVTGLLCWQPASLTGNVDLVQLESDPNYRNWVFSLVSKASRRRWVSSVVRNRSRALLHSKS